MSLLTDRIFFRHAVQADARAAWSVLESAKGRMKAQGRTQWQGSYPSPDSVREDIDNGYGYVLELPVANDGTESLCIAAYGAIVFDGEPAYGSIEGRWISEGPYVAVHRLAVADDHLGQGLAELFLQKAAGLAFSRGIRSFRVDTNYDNVQMLHILDKMGFVKCGTVMYESPRLAFEKILDQDLMQ